MNPSKFDRWPRYERVRLVLITRGDRWERPWQGFVIDWRRHSYKWSALVAYIDDRENGHPLRMEWLPETRLRPVDVNPNPSPDDEWF